MTPEEIINMAREAGFVSAEFWPDDFKGLQSCVERFAALVAERERKECAKACDGLEQQVSHVLHGQACAGCAAAIRNRGTA